MKYKQLIRVSFGLLVVTSFSLFACSKKKAAAPEMSSLEQHALLKKLPADSLGFMIWDLDSTPYKQFRKTAWGSSKNSLFAGLAEQEPTTSFDALNVAVRGDAFWDAVNEHARSVAGSLQFVQDDISFSFGLLIRGRSQKGLQKLVSLMKQHLESERFSFAKEGSVSVATHPSKNTRFFFSIKDTLLTLSPHKKILEALGKEEGDQNGISKMITSNRFTSATGKLPARGSEYFLGYLDLQEILPLLPFQQMQAVPMHMKGLPIKSVALNRTMKGSPVDTVAIVMNDTAEKDSTVLASLASGGNQSALEVLPGKAVAGIGLDASLIARGLKPMMQLPTAQRNLHGLDPDSLDSLISIAVGLEDVAPGALFPSLCLSFSIAPDSSIVGELKKIANGQLKGNTGMQMAWQKKEIEGVEIEYVLTPLGIGLYVTEVPGRALVASSEQALRKMLLAHKTGNGYVESLPASLQKMSETDPLLQLSVSFPAVATTVRNVSGSLAMFTGGQTLYEEKQLKALEAFGLLGVSISYKDKTFLVHNYYTQPKKSS